MAIFLIASDIFDIKNSRIKKSSLLYSHSYRPLISIAIPAHNEEKTLERNLLSIVNNHYKHIEIIVINDHSTDKTFKIAKAFQRKNKKVKVRVLNALDRGKARALNRALKFAKGSLFMCLDADSALSENALEEVVKSFRNKMLGCLPSNVKIFSGKGLLNLLQRIEYLVGYQMKKAETLIGTQYIVGGIGSVYRMRIIRDLHCYETDTITEDIDLSMRLIERYGKKKIIGYNPSMVVYTEAVTTISDLLSQRFRWKYGRYQVFLKRNKLFYSFDNKYSLLLSWVYLPYSLFSEVAYFLEPLTIFLIFYLLFVYGSISMIIGSFLTFCFYTSVQITGATQSYSKTERIKLIAFAPMAFVFMYSISYVEYLATVKGFLSIKKLIRDHHQGITACEWVHVQRS